MHPNDLVGHPYNSTTPAENQWQVSAAAIMRELRRYDLAPENARLVEDLVKKGRSVGTTCAPSA